MIAKTPWRPVSIAVAALCLTTSWTGYAHASDADYAHLSDALALGLPVIAAGISVAHDDVPGLFQLGESEALALGATTALKLTVREQRPNGRDEQSFPSGHTAAAFAAAQYLHRREGWQYGLPAYLAAGVVAYSRVQAHEHYWIDVLGGAALGMASSYYLTEPRTQTQISFMHWSNTTYVQISRVW